MGVKIRLRGKNKYFYLDINIHGKRVIEALHFSEPKDKERKKDAWKLANQIRTKRELQLAANRYQILDPIKSRQTIVSYANEIAKTYDKKAHLTKSLKYLEPYAGETLLCDIDHRFVDSYKAYLLSQEALGNTTAAHYLEAFKALLTRAERENLIERNPAIGVKRIKLGEQKKVSLTVAQIQTLLDTPVTGGVLAEQCKNGFLLACFTGLRLSDIKTLSWEDIQLTDEPVIVKVQQKTKMPVRIGLSPTAVKILSSYRNDVRSGLVFPRLTSSKSVNVHQPLIALRKKANIDIEFGWHAARHSFAMMVYKKSGDIYAVSKLLGHSDISITTKYLRLLSTRADEIMKEIPELDFHDKEMPENVKETSK